MDVYAQKGQEWLVTTGADLAANVVAFIIVLIVGKLVISALCSVLQTSLSKAERLSEILRSFIVSICSKVLWVIVLMIGLSKLGIDIGPMIAGLGVAGFVLGFAFQESLSNLASGFMILLNEPFKVGDYVETAGTAGAIKELSMMSTTLTTPDNKRVTIPNRAVWGGTITNYSAEETRRVDLVVGIGYASDIGKAREVIAETLTANEMVLSDPEPTIEVVEMADSSVNLVVRPWVESANYWAAYFGVTRAVKEAFDANGIEIPFPQVDVHQRS